MRTPEEQREHARDEVWESQRNAVHEVERVFKVFEKATFTLSELTRKIGLVDVGDFWDDLNALKKDTRESL